MGTARKAIAIAVEEDPNDQNHALLAQTLDLAGKQEVELDLVALHHPLDKSNSATLVRDEIARSGPASRFQASLQFGWVSVDERGGTVSCLDS